MRPDLVAVTSTTRPSTVASTAAIQLSAPLWGASAMACMSAPFSDAPERSIPSGGLAPAVGAPRSPLPVFQSAVGNPFDSARSQGEPSHQIERGTLLRMHHRGLERRSEVEVPRGAERTEPEPAAISGVPF